MTRPLVTVPEDLIESSSFNWDIDWRGQPGAESTADTTQVVFNRFPRWVGSLDPTLTRELIGRWRALRWSAQGRAGIYRLPMLDPAVFNRLSVLSAQQVQLGNPFSTGSYFSTGSGFYPGPYVEAAESAAAGASEVRLTVPMLGLVPVPGQIISADDWPMGVTYVIPEGGDTYLVGVQMPLRAAITAGDAISLVGIGRFEVTDDLAGRAAYGQHLISTPSIEFREVLAR
ncbi:MULTISPECIES: hypothetical protein [Roseobacteraceae]|uniref:hypothetical protein n=1 Tax=Roseobacteraceae TaxID=2854170 RepID=UPI0031E1767C